VFLKGFWLTLFPVIEEIMPEKTILYDKNSYLVKFENFNFCDFFTFGQFLLKIGKKLKFSKLTKFYFLWSKMTSFGIISTKTSKSPGKSSEIRTAF